MIEYEYSFKVSNINPFIEYCITNNYKKNDTSIQNRTLYKNNRGILGRITTTTNSQYFDLKQENDSNVLLNKSKETSTLLVNEENKEFIYSLLNFFDLTKSHQLKRTRHTYSKNAIKFEIDEYTGPTMFVVAIEGDKTQVDSVFNDIKSIYDQFKI